MELAEAVQNLYTPEALADPYPYYAVLTERAPVLVTDHLAVVSSYAACSAVLRDARFGVADARWMDRNGPDWRDSAAMRLLDQSMLLRNSPDHERMRRLVSREFTARRVAGLAPTIERLTGGLCDRMAEAGAAGEPVDFMAEFAYPLPVTVISELLGVPEADRPKFRQWSQDLTLSLEPFDSWAELAPADAAAVALRDYFADLADQHRGADQRRNRPETAGDGSGLVAALVDVHDEDGGRLTADELFANLALLLVAGFETTTNLLGNGLRILLDRPEAADALRADPGPAAAYVEEILRFDSPVQFASRGALVDIDVEGVTIPAGREVSLLPGAANRDPSRFADPDRFDPARPDNQPMSFGTGAHYCLGSALARLEAQIAIPALLRRFPKLTLAAPPVRRNRFVLRGYDTLPVFTTGASTSLRG
ncbi:MAG TPA: cytochrome P450 [Mycobacteriales bacterium]|nr:cytochrome P450 [Mycobacteriales bacterium]